MKNYYYNLLAELLIDEANKNGMTAEIKSELKILEFLDSCSKDELNMIFDNGTFDQLLLNDVAKLINSMEKDGTLSSKQADAIYDEFYEILLNTTAEEAQNF